MAIVVGNCVGKKRTLFDEIPGDQVFATTPPSSKKLRAAASPNSFHSFSAQAQLSHTPLRAQNLFAHQSHTPPDALLDHLRALFPEMDPKVVAETLESAEHNLEAAIKCLEELRLSATNTQPHQQHQQQPTEMENPRPAAQGDSTNTRAVHDEPSLANVYANSIVQEMAGASDIADAHTKAERVLQAFAGEVTHRVSAAAAVENEGLKNHIQALARDNTILKRAVAIQNQRQQEYTTREAEVVQLQQTVVQYQEQLRHAELHNYALSMHLRQAAGGASQSGGVGGRNPDIC
mmetsp:Transcript_13226/g.25298  ORF Transcript_13226/g.25298 Transcript_13226/m.25298 type:complete len:291 (-) Transcript_13226:629-1501(-)|eukprot:CAMPEP_0114256830 /NCGR_PEP_ID=MMETSP0058-20121206/18388_1 /TAXON_ID=36894 /ORGANISM="Pyramimonas parkeae, CCMP726" /LENGTH=290 /DNA_ID=CAMNT_0001371475 /DNA_START=447 /DNA_END=1319 /DNA_ORIENTATION=-